MKYLWKDGARVKGVEAQVAGERLETIRSVHNGRLTPTAVLDDARPDDSPLHPAFEWDDSVAAEAHRHEQARSMIRSVVVRFEERPKSDPVRAFVHVLQQDDADASYTSLAHAMQTPELRGQVLARAMAEVKSWRQRYKDYEELGVIFDAVDEVQVAA